MTTFLVGVGAVGLTYLIGSIPFGLLIARWVKGIDIRSVGSGNIGATNVGRTLGFRYFLLVFALDLAKGLLPTLYLPRAILALNLPARPDLPVFIGLAAILGHNFPIYLKFKGGKGVATSLGVLFALDAGAGLSALIGFLVFLSFTGFVSLSSILGGICFVAVHFMRTDSPFSRDQIAMSLVTFGLLGLVVVRHRANLKRIATGTEPKVSLRRRRKGSVRTGLVVLIVFGGAALGLGLNSLRRNAVTVGSIHIQEVARLATGHQRAERMLFVDGGRKLAISCPRYGRVVLAEVGDGSGLKLVKDIQVEGRPVALAATRDRIFVLQRPHGDARHLEEAYWDTFNLSGEPAGPRVRVGYDPDDMQLTEDGRHALVLTSGHAEGETNRPNPALTVFELGDDLKAVAIARIELDAKGDDPARLALSKSGKLAAVSIQKNRSIAWFDLSNIRQPRLEHRELIAKTATPEAIWFDQRDRLWLADPEGVTVGHQKSQGQPLEFGEVLGNTADINALAVGRPLLAVALPRSSSVALIDPETAQSLARLPIRGTANLAATRPLGLAVSPDGKLLAVSNRAGGSVHLFRVTDEAQDAKQLVANAEPTRR